MMITTIAHQSQEWGVCADINTLNSGVGKEFTTNENTDVNTVDVPQELESDFGDAPYWTNGTNLESYMLSVISTYSNMDRFWSTPQYGFSRGMTEFKQKG